MSIWNDTLDVLNERAKVHDSCLVAYSGGKDSLAVMDLCCKTFKRVVGFYMFLVPGLACIEQQLDYARKRWGVQINHYPHWLLFRCLKHGVYCDESYTKDDMPEFSLHDIYSLAKSEAGIPVLATGAKSADSLWRRRFFNATKGWDGMLYPIKDWNKFDVIAYLKANDIPIPDSSSGNATGVDLSTPSLLLLHDKHPEDFKKLLHWFPFAEAVVWRRTFYGVT